MKRYAAWSEILKALANPIRLFIIEELQKGEKSVSDFNELLHIDISTISRHLSILKNTGVIDSEKKGTKVIYRLKIPCVVNFLTCVQSVLKEKIEEQQKLI
jgi:ArsR family transcriptional regulator